MDPKKKNIVYIVLIVAAVAFGGYRLWFSGSSSNAQSQTGKLVKKTRAPVDGLTKQTVKKKAARTATKKTGLVKKGAGDRKKNTLKKRPGKRGRRKTKKKEIAPAA